MQFPKQFFSRISWEEKSSLWDAQYNFRRPINEQHLSPYKAMLRLSKDYFKVGMNLVALIVSLYCVHYVWETLGEAGVPTDNLLRIISCGLMFVFAILIFFVDKGSIFWTYRPIGQRDSMGTARWASIERLKDKNLISKVEANISPARIALAPIGEHHMVSMAVPTFAQHGIVIGPSGSGKTSTFYMGVARQFAKSGGLVALDIAKSVAGEFYAYTAGYYDDVFRFDLMTPAHTDWFDLMGFCRGSAINCGKVSSYIIGRDANTSGGGGGDIWDKAAEGMLKCLLLHISTTKPDASPSDIFDFLADHPTDGPKGDDGKPRNLLKEAMELSPLEDVKVEWASIFSAVGDSSPKTYGSILFTMTTNLQIFRDPKVKVALRKPTQAELNAGRRAIDFKKLRKMTCNTHNDSVPRGSAVFIVVAEGEASRLGTVISTFLAVAKDILKQSGSGKDAHVLFAIDEAANGAKIPNLSEDYGVGRGRRMINLLGLQGISQLAKQYGREIAQTIIENNGLFVIFPGAKDQTAEWASKMLGKTTILLKSSSDSNNDNFDSEKVTEHQRDLMTPDEIRQMKWFTNMLLIINDAPPIKCRVNDDAKAVDKNTKTPKQLVFQDSGGFVQPKSTLIEAAETVVTRNDTAQKPPSSEPENKTAGDAEPVADSKSLNEPNLVAADVAGGNASDARKTAETSVKTPTNADPAPNKDAPVDSPADDDNAPVDLSAFADATVVAAQDDSQDDERIILPTSTVDSFYGADSADSGKQQADDDEVEFDVDEADFGN